MKIHAHILSWNEEKILPFTLDYYSKFCEKIFVWDNESSDNSDEIYKKYDKVNVIKWSSEGKIDDTRYVFIKSNAYKELSNDCDWVIVCDCDEILYHPNIVQKLKELKNLGIDCPKIDGRDMFSENFPEYDGRLITEIVQYGSPTYEPMCKSIVFNPKINMQFGIGAHRYNCNGCKESEGYELMLLHYKFLGLDYIRNRYQQLANRLSEQNKRYGWGSHYTDKNATSYHKLLEETKIKIINE